jgi:hypothetical protein
LRGVAGCDEQALVAVDEADHGDPGTVAEQPVDVGERVLTAGRVEKV